MPENILEVNRLCKSFGALKASNNLSFSVKKGDIHAIIGPNGAGKTTAINQLTGELAPDSGTVIFDGMDITKSPVYRRSHLGLARSYQITSIFEEMSVMENISLALQAHTGHSFSFFRNTNSDKKSRNKIIQGLETVGLLKRGNMKAKHLSHGEKKQLEVGMALMGKPKLLLLDEPMAGMGPGGTVEMTKLIKELSTDITILLVEHDMDVVFSIADCITALVYGEAVVTGTGEVVKSNPIVREAYLGDGE